MHNTCVKSLFILLSLISLLVTQKTAFAQTGPGGVGNSNGSSGQPENLMWLDASFLSLTNGAAVTNWSDRSGNGRNGSVTDTGREPMYNSSLAYLNKPSLSFSGDRLDIQSAGDAIVNSDYTIIVVGARRSTGSQRWIGGRASTSSDQNLTVGWSSSNQYIFSQGVTTAQSAALTGEPQLNTFGIYTHINDPSSINVFRNSNNIPIASNASGINLSSYSEAAIGRWANGSGATYYNIDVAEVIFYKSALNQVQRILIENYLSAKYSISLSANDFYTTNPSTHTFDVAGIGYSGGFIHTEANSTGFILSPANGTLDTDGEFLIAGHDNTTNTTSNTNLGTGIVERWARSWYLDKTGTLDAALTFDFSEAFPGGKYPVDKSGYALLRYNGSTYENVNISEADKSISGDKITFNVSDVNLTDGIYTLGSTDNSASPVAGLDVRTWYSYQTGNWNDPNSWTLDGGVLPLLENPANEIPQPTDRVIISSGRTISMNVNNIVTNSLEVIGELDLGASTGHNFNIIQGNGWIRMNGDNFPAGDASDFISTSTGGTVEIYGTGATISQAHTFNHLVLNLTSSSNTVILTNHLMLNGNLSIQQGKFQINNTIASSRNITVYGDVNVEANGAMSVGTASARHEFTMHGSFTNNGNVAFTNRSSANYGSEATDGIVDVNFVSDTEDQYIACNNTTKFYRIEIDKGADDSYSLHIDAQNAAYFQLLGYANESHGEVTQLSTNANALGLIRGTVRIGTNVNIPVLNNSGNYNISAAAQLWVDGGKVVKPAGTAIVPYGKVKVSSGSLEALVNSGITLRDNGSIIVEGGSLYANQIRTSTLGAGNVGGFVQSGGTVIVNGGTGEGSNSTGSTGTNTSYCIFNLTFPGNVFSMSGGTLHIKRANTRGGIFINSDVENISVTGGTVIMGMDNGIDFKLTSTAPFWNVNMRNTGSGTPAVRLEGNTIPDAGTVSAQPLIVKASLTLEANTIFNALGTNVNIGNSLTINATGTYTTGSNTTTFDSNAHSVLTLNGTRQFYNFAVVKDTEPAEVEISSGSLQINNELRVEQGVLRYNTTTIEAKGNLYNAGTIGLTGSSGKLLLNGTSAQTITVAEGNLFTNLELNNPGTTLTGGDMSVRGTLTMISGHFNISTFKLTMQGVAANISGAGATKMIQTTGNDSDGGLEMYVDADETITFPIGIGTQYTPATVDISSNYSDDGYIRVNPVNERLSTLNTSGNALAYYWRVRHSGFTDESRRLLVSTWAFTYSSNIPNNIGEPAYVIFEDDPDNANPATPDIFKYQRVKESDGVSGATITFDGQLGQINGSNAPRSAGNFSLVDAKYTAANQSAVNGSVKVYYTKRYSADGWNVDWRSAGLWTLAPDDLDGNGKVDDYEVHDSRQTSASSYPVNGDIAVIGWVPWNDPLYTADRGKPHGVALNRTETMSELYFDQMMDASGNPTNRVYASNFQFRPTLVINPSGALSTPLVNGEGLFWLRSVGGTKVDPSFNAIDLGNFVNKDSSYFIYEATGNFSYTNIPATVPNLMVATDGWGSQNRNFTLSTGVTVNQDLELLGDVNLFLSGTVASNITVKRDLLIFRSNANGNDSGGGGEIAFPNTASRTIEIFGDLHLINEGALINIRSANSTVNVSYLTVHGNVIQNSAGGSPNGLVLFSGTGLDYIQLELKGTGSHSYTRASGDVVSLHNLTINKGDSPASTFTFHDSFTLNGPTNSTTKALTLQNGTLILNDPAININLSTGGSDFAIPATAALEVTQGTANVSGSSTGVALDGILRINGGTVNVGTCGTATDYNYIEYSASGNALLEISNGSLSIGSQIRRGLNSTAGILKYRQTGGVVTIGSCPTASPVASRAMLEVLNTGSEFTHTGGTLTIVRQNDASTATASLLLEPSAYNTTNSDIYLGNANTPSGQTNFNINSSIALNKLTLSGINNPVFNMSIRSLALNGELNINSGATLNANGLQLTLNADFVNNGIFTPAGNTTLFSGTASQQIRGSTNTTFFALTKSTSNTLTLSGVNASVAGNFRLQAGTFNDGGNTLTLRGDMVHDGIHTTPSTSSGQGILFAGTSRQELSRRASGTSTFGKVSIDNPSGVIIPEGDGYNFDVTNVLRLKTGVFDIGGSLLTLTETANVEAVNAFGSANMIQTNSSFTDNGLRKRFNVIGSATTLIFPVGHSKYTPIRFDITASSAGGLTVRPANERHPSIVDDTEDPEIVDMNNVLQYHWIVKASGISGFTGDVTFTYSQSDVEVTTPYTEADYIPAFIYSNNTFWDKSLPTSSVDEVNNTILFPFNNVTDNNLTGEYTAGIPDAIPNQIPQYESAGTGGNYIGQATWTPLNGSPAVVDGVGPVGAIITVKATDVVSLTTSNIRIYRTILEPGSVLEVNQTIGHRLGEISGTGILRISSNTNSAVLPAGNYESFFSCSGGTLEYTGSGNYNILGGISTLRNLTIDGSGIKTMANTDLTVCNDLVLKGSTLLNSSNRTVNVQNNMTLSGGAYTNQSGTLNISRDLTVSNGTFNAGTGGTKTIGRDLTLSNGTFQVGSGGAVSVARHLTYSGGTFHGGDNSGSAKLVMAGTTAQIITGNFTGTDARFHRLEINNSSTGVTLAGDVDINDELILERGIVRPGTNNLKLNENAAVSPDEEGRSNAYVNGKLLKVIPNGGSFIFPVGKSGRWGYIGVNNVSSSSTLTWQAEYFNANLLNNESSVTNLTPSNNNNETIETISQNEYWKVSDDADPLTPPSGGESAKIQLRWDNRSDVASDPTEHSDLRVMYWNSSTSLWDNAGGTGHVGTQALGTLESGSAITFSEKIITMGSTDLINTLPVELISFTVKMEDRVALLNWQTASERNNDFFEVQRSVNGQDWTTIGFVEGAGDSDQELSYSFTDTHPVYGISYYRLRQVDFDAQYEYSKVIVLENVSDDTELPQPEVLLYPNPAHLEKLIIRAIHLQPWQEVEVSLTDVYGKQYVYELVKPEVLEKGLGVRSKIDLPSGLYLVSIKQGSTWIQKKLILKE